MGGAADIQVAIASLLKYPKSYTALTPGLISLRTLTSRLHPNVPFHSMHL